MYVIIYPIYAYSHPVFVVCNSNVNTHTHIFNNHKIISSVLLCNCILLKNMSRHASYFSL